MSLLIRDDALARRRAVAAGPLEPLAASLAADLAPLLDRDIYFPDHKALLSREGGRCARDGTLLEFDPFQPREHRCPRCGDVYRGELHDRFWIYWYQLWLAERAVHAALLATLGVNERFATLAASILDGYVDRYASYPNVDNVLGPTRLFFSTYLESIWLLQICMATDVIAAAQPGLADRVRDRIIEPSRAIIAEYNEGGSNRQVWNAVALLAAARVLCDESAAEGAVFGDWGIAAQLEHGLLADGTWYEGENYHLFAHRGLWYGVAMAECGGLVLPAALVERFQMGFATPFATALPDLTLPSRRDSQYAISLRQWRVAEHCELGFARREDLELGGALARLYADDVPRRDTGRRTSSADVERNAPASALARADLSWRALLCARETLPALEPIVPRSSLLNGQGIAVFRRNSGRSYVALDFGHSGGGHGHPDRLNLLLADGDIRWLGDYGTGSYVDPSLHWYRSSLAHNAPLVDGKSQRPVNGTLAAYDERGAAGWISAVATGVSQSVTISRTLVVMSDYIVDELSWQADRDVTIDLPLHADIELNAGVARATSAVLAGSTGTEDGFRFLHDTSVQRAGRGTLVHGVAAPHTDHSLTMWSVSERDAAWWRAVAPGPPGTGDSAFRVLRTSGREGRVLFVIAWTPEVAGVSFDDGIHIVLTDGSSHVHCRTAEGWHVDLLAGEARSSIDLGGLVSEAIAAPAEPSPRRERAPIVIRRVGVPVVVELGERNYRRSEQAWAAAGALSARVAIAWTERSLALDIDVPRSDLTFAAAAAANRYDNEHPDINGDGAQLYLATDTGRAAWLLVPDPASAAVRVRQLEGWSDPAAIAATWARVGQGYRITARVTGLVPRAIDVIVNEMPKGRERRRGQLVLSGGDGQFVYLRGDRHETDELVPLELPDV